MQKRCKKDAKSPCWQRKESPNRIGSTVWGFFFSSIVERTKRGYNCDSGGNSLMPTIAVRPTEAFSCFFFFSFSFAISPKYPQIFRNLSHDKRMSK